MTPQVTTVVILSSASCGECHAAGLCGMANLAEKTVEVPTNPYASYGVGDEVEVTLKASMGFKAVWLAYCIPLVILLAVILGLLSLGLGEVTASVAGLSAIVLYYLLLWLFRGKLQNEYVFTIKR
ncbi:MAG: SoxR reducing system RseC family protein [Bacteroidales bacterium]|nr:SoxR reducing system RseC family protein [Bacteroidales bacterium]